MLNRILLRWRLSGLLYSGLLSFAVAVVVTRVSSIWWGEAVWIVGFVLLTNWKMRMSSIVSFLNRRVPELEESCELLLKTDLNGLEQLQAAKIGGRLREA